MQDLYNSVLPLLPTLFCTYVSVHPLILLIRKPTDYFSFKQSMAFKKKQKQKLKKSIKILFSKKLIIYGSFHSFM